MLKLIRRSKDHFNLRNKYCTKSRIPFYDLAGQYLPSNKDGIVVDVGCGRCFFAKQLDLKNKYKNLYLLDNSSETVSEMGDITKYKAPDKLPFENKAVDYLHCSHLIEHLYPEDLYEFLKEIDRVLSKGGVLVISAPMLWDKFYGNMSHIKPYYPKVFINYLCIRDDGDVISADPTYGAISREYKVENLVYRYSSALDDSWGARFFVIDLLMKVFRRVLFRLGIRKYVKTGYSIILRKTQ